ncbi:MAG: ZrgA family zinc uptake protein [Hydrogenovibrio sp.]
MMFRPLTLLACAFSGLLAANVQADTHAAHEHGVAELNMVQDGQWVMIEIHTPAYNVFGFEYKPSRDEDKTLVKQRLKQIQTDTLIRFNPQARCHRQSGQAQNPFHAHDDEHNHHHEHGHEQAPHQADQEHSHDTGHRHRDLQAEITYRCQNPHALARMDLAELFKSWPQLQTVRTQWILGDQQSAATLTRQEPKTALK